MDCMSACFPNQPRKLRFASVTKERNWLAAENKALREEIKQLRAALHVYRDVVIRLSVKQEAA